MKADIKVLLDVELWATNWSVFITSTSHTPHS